ncbi:MAG TPA: hypothetical protein VHB98_06845, partial [Chloroflexota bacterium]|nr:hypothetical protein [Chloroflexota bacterium]
LDRCPVTGPDVRDPRRGRTRGQALRSWGAMNTLCGCNPALSGSRMSRRRGVTLMDEGKAR